MRVRTSWAVAIVTVLAACTGDPVGESAGDAAAGTGGVADAGTDSSADAPGDAGGGAGVQVLAAGRDCPADLRVHGGTVTWVDQGSLQNSGKDGVVASMPSAGCSDDSGACIVELATAQHSPAALEIDPLSNDVFWSTVGDGTVWRLPSQATTPEAFATGQTFPRSLAVDDVALYWTNAGVFGAGDGEVRRRYLDGGTQNGVAIIGALESPVEIATRGMQVYFTSDGSSDTTGYVSGADVTGAAYAKLVSNQSHPRGIAVSATHVYWANSGDGTIWRAKLDGSESLAVVSGRPTPSDVAVDAEGVYWVEAGTPAEFSDGAVVAARLDGKDVVVLAEAQRDPRKLAVDATHVYWLNRGTQGVKQCTQHDGSVRRVPRPW